MFQYHINNISKIIDDTNERLEGNVYCDISSKNIIHEFKVKQENIKNISKNKNKIMEIGFNAGHSVLLMLLENPNAEYLLFDLGNHSYTKPCFEYLKESFSETKINIIYGDSIKTIKDYINSNPNEINQYDFIHIDGGHEYEVLDNDFIYSKVLLNNDGLIIIDDTNYEHINNYINSKINNNEIIEIYSEDFINNKYHRLVKKI